MTVANVQSGGCAQAIAHLQALLLEGLNFLAVVLRGQQLDAMLLQHPANFGNGEARPAFHPLLALMCERGEGGPGTPLLDNVVLEQ